jgi:hypothetical protein
MVEPDSAGQSWAQQRADAFVEMAMSYLNGSRPDAPGTPGMAEHHQVVVHVDHSALTEGRGRAGLPIESVRRIACDSDRVVLIEDERGEPLSIGRKARVVSAAIRRALWARDRGCRFPGCGRKRFVDAHHVEHWSAGGETSLDNLMLLCHSHHKLCHEGGFTICKDYRDRWFFRRPDGVAVPPSGYRLADMTDDDVCTEGEYLDGNPSAEGFAGEDRREGQVREQAPVYVAAMARAAWQSRRHRRAKRGSRPRSLFRDNARGIPVLEHDPAITRNMDTIRYVHTWHPCRPAASGE